MIRILLVIMFLFVGVANATKYYVDNTTNGTCSNGEADYDPDTDECDGDGTYTVYSHPQLADDAGLEPGDIVIVADGTYKDNDSDAFTFEIKNSLGTPDAWITFKAENKWGAVIDGDSNADSYGISISSSVDYVRIEDFEIKDTSNAGVLNNNGADYIYLYRNKIHGIGKICTDSENGRVGTNMGAGTSYMTVDSNIFYDIGRLRPDEDGCSGLVTEYYENHDHGIYVRTSNHTIINNIFYDFDNGWPIHLYGGVQDEIYIINNTFDGANPDRNGHIATSTGTETIYIENNISNNVGVAIVNNSSCGGSEDIRISNNLTTESSLVYGVSTCATSANNYTNTSPKFTDEENNDYTLTSSSDAIYAGLSTYAPEFDYDGNFRANPPSIGAYAYCPGLVVRESNSYEYITILSAYYASSTGETLLMPENTIFIGDMNFGRNLTVTLEGGLTCDLTSQVSNTMINGDVTISSGTVIMDNIYIY